MKTLARSRSSTHLRISPDPKSKVMEILGPNDPLEVMEEAGDMVMVASKRLMPPTVGYVPKSSVVRRIPRVEIFSKYDAGDGTLLDPAPHDLPVIEFETWLRSGGEPAWLLTDGKLPLTAGDRMRSDFEPYRESWSKWFTSVQANNRAQTAKLDDWYALISGGREMWSFRPERIFRNPSESSPALGWAGTNDILYWTGRVHYSEKEWKYKLWYQIELTKLDRSMKGWYKAALLEDFVFPEVYIESDDRAGIAALFDMSRPKLRFPADPEIEEARQAKRNSLQYINIRNATGHNKIHYNLCGQFCVAALSGMDVIPMLKKWYQTSRRGKTVLEGGQPTFIHDLKEILDLHNVRSEIFRPEPSVAPVTPGYLEKMLNAGKKAIFNVGLSYKGEASYNGKIRHWLVATDIVRMGNGGWTRVYNSFFNREEVYPYQRLFNTGAAIGLGLWVDAPDFTA